MIKVTLLSGASTVIAIALSTVTAAPSQAQVAAGTTPAAPEVTPQTVPGVTQQPVTQQPTQPVPSGTDPSSSPPAGADQSIVGDIVVTAERRTSTVQRTPIAITAITGQTLAERQLNSINDIQGTVPSFRIGTLASGVVVSIRGIGISSALPTVEGAAAVNINDVYVARLLAQPLGFYDVSSLEVLRGPQGTLYGRNATAGALNIHTTLPTNEFSGYGRITIGNYGTFNGEGAVGGPLIDDTLLVRLAGRIERNSGYTKNLATGNRIDDRDTWSLRGTVVAKPTSTLTGTLILEGARESNKTGAAHYFGGGGLTGLPGASGQPPLFIQQGGDDVGIRNVNQQYDPRLRTSTFSAIGKLDWALSDNLTLRSISGYRFFDNVQQRSPDVANPGVLLYVSRDHSNQFSQELQAVYSSRVLDVTLGGFYYHDDEVVDPTGALLRSDFLQGVVCPAFGISCPALPGPAYFTATLPYRAHQKVRSLAGFVQADLHLTSRLTLTGGVRYTDERKLFAQDNTPDLSNANPILPPYTNLSQYPNTPLGPERTASFTAITPKAGLEFQLNPRTLLYATYAKGFKSGGFEISIVAPPYRPENLTDFEGGIKTRLFNGRVTANLAGFYYKYSDLQVQQQISLGFATVNAGKATLYGMEGEVSAVPIDHLRIDINGSYIHSRYDEFFGVDTDRPQLGNVDYSGNRLSNAPKFSGQIGGEYSVPVSDGKVTFRAEVQYSSRYFLTPVNVNLESQGAFAKGNLFLTYNSPAGWKAQAFVRNVTNKITLESLQTPGVLLGSPLGASVSAPRLIGIDFSYAF